jgi:hypothetical protein
MIANIILPHTCASTSLNASGKLGSSSSRTLESRTHSRSHTITRHRHDAPKWWQRLIAHDVAVLEHLRCVRIMHAHAKNTRASRTHQIVPRSAPPWRHLTGRRSPSYALRTHAHTINAIITNKHARNQIITSTWHAPAARNLASTLTYGSTAGPFDADAADDVDVDQPRSSSRMRPNTLSMRVT